MFKKGREKYLTCIYIKTYLPLKKTMKCFFSDKVKARGRFDLDIFFYIHQLKKILKYCVILYLHDQNELL